MSDLINGWCLHNVPLTSCPTCQTHPALVPTAAKQERINTPEQWQRAVSEGRRLERAAIVADLRRKADIVSAMASRDAHAVSVARALRERADRYERGEHEEGT